MTYDHVSKSGSTHCQNARIDVLCAGHRIIGLVDDLPETSYADVYVRVECLQRLGVLVVLGREKSYLIFECLDRLQGCVVVERMKKQFTGHFRCEKIEG